MLIASSKSQLAIEYAHRVAKKNNDTWIFWFHAATSASIEQDFRRLADKVKLSGRRNPKANIPLLVHDWLSDQQNGKWLIILDSADDGNVFYSKSQYAQEMQPLASYFPQTQNGSILVTARDKDVARKLTGEERNLIDVGPLAEEEALKLLEKKLGPVSDQTQALELVEALECIALAIIQAAAYIQAKSPRTSITKYLKTLRASKKRAINLLEHEGGHLRRDTGGSNAVLKTWHISFQHIREKRESAGDLLALMSFFDRQDIPEWVLKERDNQDAKTDEHTTDNHSDVASTTSSEEDRLIGFEQDIDMLRDFCLISVSGELNDAFDMHRLVQLSTRLWLESNGLQEHFHKLFVLRMAHAFPNADFEHWIACQKLLPHVEGCVNYSATKQDTITLCRWSTLVLRLSKFYCWNHVYGKAERLARLAIDAFTDRFGTNHHNTSYAKLRLAEILCNRGDLEEAEELQLAAFNALTVEFGADHPLTLEAMLAGALTSCRKMHWKRVEEISSKVAESCKVRLKGYWLEEYWRVLKQASSLVARAYCFQGKWKEAETAWSEVSEMCSRVLGSQHKETLEAINFVNMTYILQKKWDDAEIAVLQNLQTCKKVLGEKHPTTLTAITFLVSLRSDQKRNDEVEELEKRLLQEQELIIATGYERTMFLEASLLRILDMPERQDEVVAKCLQLLDIWKLTGTPYSVRFKLMKSLIQIYMDQDRLGDAEKLALEAFEGLKKEVGLKDPKTQYFVLAIAEICCLLERWNQYEDYLKLVIENGSLHTKHNKMAAMFALSRIHSHRERWGDARIAMLEALEFSREAFGPDHEYSLSAAKLVDHLQFLELSLEKCSGIDTAQLLDRMQLREQVTDPGQERNSIQQL